MLNISNNCSKNTCLLRIFTRLLYFFIKSFQLYSLYNSWREPKMEIIEKNIRFLCTKDGISIPELAEKIGISFSGLYSSLRNDTLKVKTLRKIANVFNIKAYELLYEKENLTANSIKKFLDHPLLDFLSKRNNSFTEKVSFYKDYFVWSILQNINEAFETPPPFPEKKKQETLLTSSEIELIRGIPIKIRETPYSKWPSKYKGIIDNLCYILESFYFMMFYYNFLSIVDYLNDDMINNNEINYYWKLWKEKYDKIDPIIIEYLE